MADAVVLLVEAASDPEVEPLHSRRQPLKARLDDDVEVVRHHAVREVRPPEPEARTDDPAVDVRIVEIVVRDPHPVDAAGRHVVDRRRGEQVAWARHWPSVAAARTLGKPASLFFSRIGTRA
jgi:hypothetical protein